MLTDERMRPLAKAAREVPGQPHIATIVRWATRGVKGVKLETIMVGGRRFTSVEAIARFIERLSEPRRPENHDGLRQPGLRRIDQLLDREGI